jgi:hypothetical protein
MEKYINGKLHKRVPVPCPDGIVGCAVNHMKWICVEEDATDMAEDVVRLINEFKKASDALQHALHYDHSNTPYDGLEEYRERVETFCLGYDHHLALNNLAEKFKEYVDKRD